MIRLAVFDLDGTLVDSLTDLAFCVNKGLAAASLPEHPVGDYKEFVGNGRELLMRRAMGEASDDAELFETVERVFNEEYALHCNDNTTAYPGCAEMLEILAEKGIMTAVHSNKPDEFVAGILQKLYPDHIFTEAWGKKPEYKTKPDAESLNAMLEKHGVAKNECIYIGDSDVDVFTAMNAGVNMAGVSWGFRGKRELIDTGAPFVADTAEQLLEYIINHE